MTLRTPTKGQPDPLDAFLSQAIGNGQSPEVLQDGFMIGGNWSPELSGWRIRTRDEAGHYIFMQRLMLAAPYEWVRFRGGGMDGEIELMNEIWEKSLNCYGVCDSPEQFDAKYGEALRGCPIDLCVTFVHVEKDPTNKWKGGGWRWHKWGEYIGAGEPTQEYLDDEELFPDGVYTFHIYEVLG
jgi:hypothetical protein